MESLQERLVEAGVELLDEQGIQAISIREVARVCGVSHGAPRRHFPSLAALLAAVAERTIVSLEHHLQAAGPGALRTARVYVEFARRRPHAFDLMSRHDLLEGSGRNVRQVSMPVLGRWLEQYRQEHPRADETAALAAWVAVHGLATRVSRRASEVMAIDADQVLVRILG